MNERRRITTRLGSLAIATLLGVVFAVLPAYAQVDLGLDYGTSLGLGTQDVRTTVGTVINAFFGLLGIVALVIILYAGFLWMTAGGDDAKVSKAKQYILNAVIGLVIILSAYAIASFIFRAVGEGTGTDITGGGTGCPPGQSCGFGGGGGGGGGFALTGITPMGSGPNDGGWPKNYGLTIGFNTSVEPTTITSSTIRVQKCNARTNGSGEPQPFDEADCDDVVTGTRTVNGSSVVFKPDASPEDEPSDFEGDFWYKVRVQGLDIKDLAGRPLYCPPTPPGPDGDMSSSSVRKDLCDRATAFNDLRDVSPPTVSLSTPSSPPATCNALVPVKATASDDFLVSRIDFRVNGGTDGLVDAFGNPVASEVNAEMDNPFTSTQIFIDTSAIAPGETVVVTATAQDGVPNASSSSERNLVVSPAHCCNGVADPDLGETGIDCGVDSMCGSCSGSSCTDDAQCASGFCDPETNRCAERPVIEDVSPIAAGPGSLITIGGRFFGANPGSIVFLGGDTDGDGDPEGDDDDVSTQACAPAAWDGTQIVVPVPSGAVTGPILLTTSVGGSDRTDDDHGPLIGAFTVNSTIIPGICFLEPNVGGPGDDVIAHGTGFGDTAGESLFTFGAITASIASGGWTAQEVTAIVPPTLQEGTHPTRVRVGGAAGTYTNTVDFTYRLPESNDPRIISIDPSSGTRESYITIRGTGFGTSKGIVRFYSTTTDDVAIALDPVCDDNWKRNSIVVKVPQKYDGGLTVAEGFHQVEVETASPSRTSNRTSFEVVPGAPGPGLCALSPDNGPAGTNVTIVGEGFGNGPAGAPESVVRFSDSPDGAARLDATVYGQWSSSSVNLAVPGDSADVSTWPFSGPVDVVGGGTVSANTLPFAIQDCNAGASCDAGMVCCANGSCQATCEKDARDSAFGWNFSTNLLPALPQVVTRSVCDATAGTIQSPTPYVGATDACKNAQVALEFSHEMDALSLDDPGVATLDNVLLEECGTDVFDDAACVPVPIARPLSIQPSADEGTVVRFSPSTAYPSSGPDAGTGFFRTDTWYRVTIISDLDAGVGVRDVLGRLLDGDLNKKQGGDFTYRFKTRTSDTPCSVQSVNVIPSSYVIDHEGAPQSFFDAALQAANCNILRCEVSPGAPLEYAMEWASVPFAPLDIGALLQNGCRAPVTGVQETAITDPADLNVQVTPTGQSLSKQGTSRVTVKFKDPVVERVMPTATCTEACINSAIGAYFNVPMDPASLTDSGNVVLTRCRNASCNEPMAPDLGGAVRTLSLIYDPEDTSSTPDVIGFEFIGDGTVLDPSTFYQVRIQGGPGGVKSRSGINLTGLNAANAYVWKFRTKDDPTACSVSRVGTKPEQTILHYVGERAGVSLEAFGPVDACSPGGQRLDAWAYDWEWSIQPNTVLEGFMRAISSAGTSAYVVADDPVVDTNAIVKRGCTSSCTLRGSQNDISQCGNGVRDLGEDCDTAIPADSGNCTVQCLWNGESGSLCGNGVLDPGEQCESAGGVWNGCKDPAVDLPERPDLNGLGCMALGSESTSGSVCGDGFVSDGETCDDRNNADGDGCSSQCVHEGSAPACSGVTPPGQACVSYCGNGIVEPGEDRDCDVALGSVAPGCDVRTCLHIGSNPPLCGNGTLDPGEDEECEIGGGGPPDYCTERCLLRGSSAYYGIPSFCGDQLVGYGEAEECEQSPDGLDDPTQYVVAQNYDPNAGESKTSTVIATTLGVPSGGEGRADVTLSCTCKTLPTEDEQNAFCANVGAGAGLDLACADSGCCVARPVVNEMYPSGTNNACRNTEISVTFDQAMNEFSLIQNMLVGFDNEGAACPDGTQEVPPLAFAGGSNFASNGGGFWSRMWSTIGGFFRGLVGLPTQGSAPDAQADHDNHRYCLVEGEVDTHSVGDVEGGLVTRATFTPVNALPPNTWVRVRIEPGAKSRDGVSIGDNGYTGYFGTSANICPIRRVTVTPDSTLLTKLTDGDRAFVAHAHAGDGQRITPVEEYAWEWSWTPQIQDGGPLTSSLMLVAEDVPTGGHAQVAHGYVRGRETTDEPSGWVPRDGEAKAEVFAVIRDSDSGAIVRALANTSLASDNGTPSDTTDDVLEGSGGDVMVMLCDNPWPARIQCGGSSIVYPWDDEGTAVDCPAGTSVWSPFFDNATNFQFSYCRDGEGAGDVGPGLPAFKEVPVRVFPGGDILREYLFTYDTAQGPADTIGEWSRDAFGFRVIMNPQHVGPFTWYEDRGFTGSLVSARVDGYEGAREGRTTYVDAAAVTDTGQIWTNINVLSHNDGASPETVAIYNQILERIDFNRQPELADSLVCRTNGMPVLIDDAVLSCTTNLDCEVDGHRGLCADGATACTTAGDCTLAGASGPCNVMECHAPKSALVRDVKRFADMVDLRDSLIGSRLPTVDSGSFMRGRTYSAWTSWSQQLSGVLGGAPVDPVNRFDSCPPGHDPATCWNADDRLFMCPSNSYVYRYRSLGNNAELYADLEYRDESGRAVWRGGSCLDLTDAASCTSTVGCTWVFGHCTFGQVPIHMGGLYDTAAMCADSLEGSNGFCGDGVVNENESGPSEVCEIGQVRPGACAAEDGRQGLVTERCTSDCLGWEVQPGSSCNAGRCGDGVVQGPDETCDDGALNGTYGYCNAQCTGSGFFCGDGKVHPSEACDCAAQNGQYVFNGVLQSPGQTCRNSGANAASCAWDCSAPAPRCGDGIVNGTEQCDGGVEISKGYCSTSKRGCSAAGDCAAGEGACVLAPTVEQNYRRSCNANAPTTTGDDVDACKWSAWVLTAPGECGNGITETGEQCDDGNPDNNDGCTNACRFNVCGDGYVNPSAGEQCDDGPGNGRLCNPDYNNSCRYCLSTCNVGQVTGGFCGDRIVQQPGLSPPNQGPEQCDAPDEAVGDDYICVSTRLEDKSFGVYTGEVICSASQCKHACRAPDSQVCRNGNATTVNSDLGALGVEACEGVTGEARELCIAHLAEYYDMPDTHANRGMLMDDCDPDDDNDGVPDEFDCRPRDPNSRPQYTIPGTGIIIPAGAEQCDGFDNDCDGLVDERIDANGTLIDVQTGNGMTDAMMQIVCGGEVIAETNIASNGAWSINEESQDVAKCAGSVTYMATYPGAGLCPQGSVVTINRAPGQCIRANNVDMQATKKPGTGQVRVSLAWSDTPRDLDLHMFTSNDKHVYYSNKVVDDEGYRYTLDVDKTRGFGPETITVNQKPGVQYEFRVHQYTSRLTAESSMENDVRVRMWAVSPLTDECVYNEATSGFSKEYAGGVSRYLNVVSVETGRYLTFNNRIDWPYFRARHSVDADAVYLKNRCEFDTPPGASEAACVDDANEAQNL